MLKFKKKYFSNSSVQVLLMLFINGYVEWYMYVLFFL